jgi:hypothetical protein
MLCSGARGTMTPDNVLFGRHQPAPQRHTARSSRESAVGADTATAIDIASVRIHTQATDARSVPR